MPFLGGIVRRPAVTRHHHHVTTTACLIRVHRTVRTTRYRRWNSVVTGRTVIVAVSATIVTTRAQGTASTANRLSPCGRTLAANDNRSSATPTVTEFYNDDEARKYTQNSRMINIQLEMAERCMELLMLPEDEPCLLLDLGCGSGLSGSVAEDSGHIWLGMDISDSMLKVAKEREVEGDLLLGDIGNGVPFQPGTFDGAYSVSTLQWLCNADKSSHKPVKRLYTLFSTLLACLGRNARAVFQFYPENVHQTDLVVSQARKAGFYGGLLVDFPDSTKAKKYFLVLMTGGAMPMPPALGTKNSQINYTSKREKMTKGRATKLVKKSREWILEKKERRRRQGKTTKEDTKYTGRSRSGRF